MERTHIRSYCLGLTKVFTARLSLVAQVLGVLEMEQFIKLLYSREALKKVSSILLQVKARVLTQMQT